MASLLPPPEGADRHRQVNWPGVLTFVLRSACAVIVLIPVYWMLLVALTPPGISTSPRQGLLPLSVTIDNFVSVFRDKPVGLWILNSFMVATFAASISCVAGFAAGYALSRFRVRGLRVAATVILVGQLIPQITIILPLYAQFSNLGLLNSVVGVGIAHVAFLLPVVTWMSKGFFDTLPRELEEAAAVDGASRPRVFWSIAVPLVLPGLGSSFIYAFIISWGDLLFARTLASSPTRWTTPVGLASFNSDFYTAIEPMMAAAITFALPVLVVFILMQKTFISGLTGGGVKG